MRELFGTGGDLGLVSMRAGERALITCHSEFACGEQGVGTQIPANARLTFDVTLVEMVTPDIGKQLLISLGGAIGVFLFAMFVIYMQGTHHFDHWEGWSLLGSNK